MYRERDYRGKFVRGCISIPTSPTTAITPCGYVRGTSSSTSCIPYFAGRTRLPEVQK